MGAVAHTYRPSGVFPVGVNMPVSAGDVYCRLTLVEEMGFDGQHTIWKCRCSCGAECSARLDKLKSGRKKSCGCLNRELVEAAKKAKVMRRDEDLKFIREAAYAKDEIRLNTLRKQKGEINYHHFELTGKPRHMAKEFREWAFLVAAVLWYGPAEDKITITADIRKDETV